jgi:hypothetical protein
MRKPEPGWGWFEPAPAGPDEARRLAVARAFARTFSGADGELALAHLKSLTLDRALGPDSPDQHLRGLEGQRQLVCHILSLVERGRSGI